MMQFSLVKNMKTKVINTENGQERCLHCEICDEELSRVFYTWGGAYQLLGIRDCSHYRWVFVGDFYLSPPQDPETKEIVSESLAKVNTNGGKYFLLPFTS